MSWDDFQELMGLHKVMIEKLTRLNEVFPGGIVEAPEVEFTPEQIVAAKEFDVAWQKWREKMRQMGGLVD